jgi:uncharacterized membrane protein
LSQSFGALLFVLGVLLVFAVGFEFFLILPFFVFLFGIVAMIVSDRKRSSTQTKQAREVQEDAGQGQAG